MEQPRISHDREVAVRVTANAGRAVCLDLPPELQVTQAHTYQIGDFTVHETELDVVGSSADEATDRGYLLARTGAELRGWTEQACSGSRPCAAGARNKARQGGDACICLDVAREPAQSTPQASMGPLVRCFCPCSPRPGDSDRLGLPADRRSFGVDIWFADPDPEDRGDPGSFRAALTDASQGPPGTFLAPPLGLRCVAGQPSLDFRVSYQEYTSPRSQPATELRERRRVDPNLSPGPTDGDPAHLDFVSLELEPVRVPCRLPRTTGDVADGTGFLGADATLETNAYPRDDPASGIVLWGGRHMWIRPIHPDVPEPDLRGFRRSIPGELVGESGRWQVRSERVQVAGQEQTREVSLSRRVRRGQTVFDVEVGCGDDGECGLDDLGGLQDAGLRWLDERGHGARGTAGLVYIPDRDLFAPRLETSPPLYRVDRGPLLLGFLLGTTRVESDLLIDVGVAVELDLTYPVRRLLRGRDRRVQVALGARLALGVLLVDLPRSNGISIRAGAFVAPYLETRVFLMPEIFIPFRIGGGGFVRDGGYGFVDAQTGLGVMWP